jgi:hypothetical protein
MSDKEAYIKEWIKKVSKQRPELGNFSICPFASKSKTYIKECSCSDIVPVPGYDVAIFILEEDITLETILEWVSFYNNQHQDYKFFEDTAGRNTYINGVQTNNGRYNLILSQPKEKLAKFRKKLLETDYYKYWDDEYLKEILEEDYNLLIKNS